MPDLVPQPVPRTQSLRDGEEVLVRPVGPADITMLGDFFETLSPQTVFDRFLTPMHRASRFHLERAARVDPRTDCVLAACVQEDGKWRFAGVGRLRRTGPEAAELAIVVGDRWHRRGIARLLLRHLTEVARSLRLAWFDSTIEPGNLRLIRFAEAVGFKGDMRYRDGVLHMRTDIAALFPEAARDPIDEHERP